MIDQSPEPASFYSSDRPPTSPDSAGQEGPTGPAEDPTRELFRSSPATAGPWSARAQHGGPPAALLARALQRLPEAAGRVTARIIVDLLGPVPVAAVSTAATVVRPGRSVVLAEADLREAGDGTAPGRTVARAAAWLLPEGGGRPATDVERLDHGPDDGFELERPGTWQGGYLDAVEWRWITGSLERPGPGTVWMRAPRLVEGEETSGVQRLMSCVDSASGVSAVLDVRDWTFVNTELSVHLLRPPVGEWLCVDATTTLAGTSVGLCTAWVHDELGPVAHSTQTLLIAPRS